MTDDQRLVQAMILALTDELPEHCDVVATIWRMVDAMRKEGIALTPPPKPQHTITLTKEELQLVLAAIRRQYYDNVTGVWIYSNIKDLYRRMEES